MAGIEDTLKLRAIGRGSLSSVLKVLVDIFWITACAILGFIWIVTIISLVDSFAPSFTDQILGKLSISAKHFVAIWAIGGTINCLGVMAISSHLRGVFETLVEGDPFVPANATRFKSIALLLAGLEIARIIVSPLVLFIINYFKFETDLPNITILTQLMQTNFITWGAVLILVVLSQVFDEGARLREDQQMTI